MRFFEKWPQMVTWYSRHNFSVPHCNFPTTIYSVCQKGSCFTYSKSIAWLYKLNVIWILDDYGYYPKKGHSIVQTTKYGLFENATLLSKLTQPFILCFRFSIFVELAWSNWHGQICWVWLTWSDQLSQIVNKIWKYSLVFIHLYPCMYWGKGLE